MPFPSQKGEFEVYLEQRKKFTAQKKNLKNWWEIKFNRIII